ncbi:hypothetical protein KLP28_06180 [Nocardioidaceae bacterium]|nr:hypothetical protein KLP28_06180 [Nocardioidaceae bacterium]
MSTAASSPDPGTDRPPRAYAFDLGQVVRAVGDVRTLVRFRVGVIPPAGRRRLRLAALGVGLLTLLVAFVPAQVSGADAATSDSASDVLLLLPTAYLAVLLVALVTAAASGGGRELVARDLAVAFPVSPTADHLGALLMAPLNIAWLLQTWTVLGLTAYALGPGDGLLGNLGLVAAQVLVLVWVLAATAIAQVLAWALEWLRRGRHGPWLLRGLLLVVGAAGAWLVLTGQVTSTLDRSPTVQVAIGVVQGADTAWLGWLVTLTRLLALTVAAVAFGAFVARLALRRAPRDEAGLESRRFAPRRTPTSDVVAMLRTDRATVWRSVPLRRGLAVLAVTPGLVALAGGVGWDVLPILPGLVCAGGALLFGVNTWCLDGRGAIWRESLPVSPGLAYAVRSWVLLEVLLVAELTTMALAVWRAGPVTAPILVATAVTLVVLPLQVVATSMQWSGRRPFAVDMRSARATPAPPALMVGYSARLALITTLTGVLLASVAMLGSWSYPVVFGVPFVLLALRRWEAARAVWADADRRTEIVAVVAG